MSPKKDALLALNLELERSSLKKFDATDQKYVDAVMALHKSASGSDLR